MLSSETDSMKKRPLQGIQNFLNQNEVRWTLASFVPYRSSKATYRYLLQVKCSISVILSGRDPGKRPYITPNRQNRKVFH